MYNYENYAFPYTNWFSRNAADCSSTTWYHQRWVVSTTESRSECEHVNGPATVSSCLASFRFSFRHWVYPSPCLCLHLRLVVMHFESDYSWGLLKRYNSRYTQWLTLIKTNTTLFRLAHSRSPYSCSWTHSRDWSWLEVFHALVDYYRICIQWLSEALKLQATWSKNIQVPAIAWRYWERAEKSSNPAALPGEFPLLRDGHVTNFHEYRSLELDLLAGAYFPEASLHSFRNRKWRTWSSHSTTTCSSRIWILDIGEK